MEKLAIISDIHGNKSALEEVLKDIKRRNIEKIICLGDLVVKGVHPEDVVDLVQKNCFVTLMGNCDYLISREDIKKGKYWTTDKLNKNQLEYLRNLPYFYDMYISWYLVRFYHASPYGIDKIFNPIYVNKKGEEGYDRVITDYEMMFDNTELFGNKDEIKRPDIICYGHIHTPNLFRYKNKMIFNVGSVGNSTEMLNEHKYLDETSKFSTVASYGIISGDLNSKNFNMIDINIVRIPYNVEKELEALEKSDMKSKDDSIKVLKSASTK